MPRLDITKLEPLPAGFGNCGTCSYRDVGSAVICYSCAAATIVHPPAQRCPVCQHPVEWGSDCGNPICDFDDRGFSKVYAIAMRTGELERAISLFKYPPRRRGWGAVFGRVLVGYLDEHEVEDDLRRFDLIVPSPGFDDRRHIEEIVQAAAIEASGRWPFELHDPRAIVRTADTPSLVSQPNWHKRREVAETDLRAALHVPDPARVAGKRILVVDDVFTGGFTLREIARALLDAGAEEVAEVVLARQMFRTP